MRAYLDKAQEKRYVTEVVASRVQLLGRPQDQKAPAAGEVQPEPTSPAEPEDDIPF